VFILLLTQSGNFWIHPCKWQEVSFDRNFFLKVLNKC
jgi:hypothetical protein